MPILDNLASLQPSSLFLNNLLEHECKYIDGRYAVVKYEMKNLSSTKTQLQAATDLVFLKF